MNCGKCGRLTEEWVVPEGIMWACMDDQWWTSICPGPWPQIVLARLDVLRARERMEQEDE